MGGWVVRVVVGGLSEEMNENGTLGGWVGGWVGYLTLTFKMFSITSSLLAFLSC